MSTIFTTIEVLNELKNSPHLTVQQGEFLNSLLNGVEDDSNKKGLWQFARYPLKQDGQNIKVSIQSELARMPIISFNITYKRVLNEAIKRLDELEAKREEIRDRFYENPRSYILMGIRKDYIYEETVKKYHGSMILPMAQADDFRVGASKGQCYGYVMEWCLSFLQNKKPFGVDYNQTVPFKPISYFSMANIEFPELNHLAILNFSIAHYQDNPFHEGSNIIDEIFFSKQENAQAKHKKETFLRFYSNPRGIGECLISLAEAEPNKAFMVLLYRFRMGHAVAFCKRGKDYHFMDPNFGWFRFKKAEDFQQWLPFYLNTFYGKDFNAYKVNSLSLATQEKVKTPKFFLLGRKIINALGKAIVCLFFPLLMIGIVSSFIYRQSVFILCALVNKIRGNKIYVSIVPASQRTLHQQAPRQTKDDLALDFRPEKKELVIARKINFSPSVGLFSKRTLAMPKEQKIEAKIKPKSIIRRNSINFNIILNFLILQHSPHVISMNRATNKWILFLQKQEN